MYKLMVQNTDILPHSNGVSWCNDSATLGTQLTFDSIKDITTGAVVSLWKDSLEIVRGVTLEPTQKRWTYNYVVQDYSFYLKNKVTKQFNNVCASDAISSLLGGAYIVGDIVPIPTIINKIYKKKTVAEIIEDILDLSKADQAVEYFKEIEGNILYIRKLSDMIITPKILLPKEINIKKSMVNMKNRIEIVASGEDNTSIIAVAEGTSEEQLFYGVLSDQIDIEDSNMAQAQNIANNSLAAVNKIEYSSTFEVVAITGGETIKANRMIYLHAGNRLNGYYKIKSANHTLNKGIHKVQINIVW